VAGGAAGAAQLKEAWRSGIPVDGLVVKEVKGGYEVRLAGGSRAFCPHSQMALPRAKDAGEQIGKREPFRITRFDEKGRNIVVSRRVILEEEEERKREALRGTLAEGMVVKGTVTSVRDFGAFVNIGPIEGLLPVSEIGWERVADLRELLSPGQVVEVAITRLDWANQRFSFSLKKTLADPWEAAAERFPAGSRHVGTVSRLTAFGAFVSLGGGIDGLLHVSRLGGGKRLKHPSEAVRVGQELEVRVESVDREKRRVSLSLAAAGAADSPGEAEDDYRDYLSAPAESPPVGSLGEALRAKLAKKERK
jgi:small subunit ribosomal protein S1